MGYDFTNENTNACVSWYLLGIQRMFSAYSWALRSSLIQTEAWMSLSSEKHWCDCTASTHTYTRATCCFPFAILGKTGLLGISQYRQKLQVTQEGREQRMTIGSHFNNLYHAIFYEVVFLNAYFCSITQSSATCSTDSYWMNPRSIFWGFRGKAKRQVHALMMFIAHKDRGINKK